MAKLTIQYEGDDGFKLSMGTVVTEPDKNRRLKFVIEWIEDMMFEGRNRFAEEVSGDNNREDHRTHAKD